MRKIVNINGNEVEAIFINNNWLFNQHHIGKNVLSMKSICFHTSSMDESMAVIIKKNMQNIIGREINTRGEKFLTKYGVLKLLSCSRNGTYESKKALIDCLVDMELIDPTEALSHNVYPEAKFSDKLVTILKHFNIVCLTRVRYGDYIVDIHIPQINIVIEYDERDHRSYNPDKETKRENDIKHMLGCDIIRVQDSKTDEDNIGYILNKIMSKIIKVNS